MLRPPQPRLASTKPTCADYSPPPLYVDATSRNWLLFCSNHEASLRLVVCLSTSHPLSASVTILIFLPLMCAQAALAAERIVNVGGGNRRGNAAPADPAPAKPPALPARSAHLVAAANAWFADAAFVGEVVW